MAVPKKRRSKSKKRLRNQCWRKKAEAQARKAYSAYKFLIKEKTENKIPNSSVD